MEGMYNPRELYPIPEESSQVDVGEMEGEGEEQTEGRAEERRGRLTKFLHSIQSNMFHILLSLISTLSYLVRKFWNLGMTASSGSGAGLKFWLRSVPTSVAPS
ncbi:hypothetical protein I305_06808 [Cryptococcus gattii E566]|nr:hypothetical protein I305_06808 [Cryptococcus gattii E566]KJD99492.1 hypothetical protein I311_06920 [Cryptococcus gattii NT-10]